MIYKNLFKNQLSNEDEFAKFQTDICVYHDDSGDYLTNEPTLDGTATLLYILTHYSRNEQVDSDKDGFSDDDEVLKYKTNPFNSDTDADGLTDSEEVLRYHTDPLIADLDRDSLSDGSIINKSTNPVNQNDPKKVLPNNETPKAEPLQAEVGKAIVLSGIVFKSGKAIIEKDTADMLARAFRMLIENKEIKVEIYGYTDNFGNEKTNMKLSQDRADAVKAWLVKNGINAERIKAIGLGSSNPIASNTTKEGRAKNHRIEFVRSK
jgi:outer membrane protein OmpA-like peptidoglycan-associated protein